MTRVARLLGLAVLSGVLAGVASFAFLKSLSWATRTRVGHGWIVWLLPLAGLAVGLTYHYLSGTAARGTRLTVHEARHLHAGVPSRMAPLIFASAVVGHLFGASVGREGAAVQMSASLTDSASRVLKVPHDDRQLLLGASLAGGFSAVLGAPFSGIFFAVQLTRRRRPLALATCAAAAAVASLTVRLLGDVHTRYPHPTAPDWTVGLPFKLIIAGAMFGLVGRVYMRLGDHLTQSLKSIIGWPPLRPVAGGIATVALAALVGRDYLGLSLPLLGNAVAGARISWWVPVLKLAFTIIALGSGFVGGEVIPLFVIGATMGSVLAGPMHVSLLLLAACGLSTVFTAAAQTGFTGVVIATELFGGHATIPTMIVAAAAWATVGREGLYVNRNETGDRPAAAPLPSR
jgi:H+/Cl- antiporter ClcA